jgi:hypothetical protein
MHAPLIESALHAQVRRQTNRRRPVPLLSPTLLEALTELAASEGLSVATLITLLINDGLSRRRSRS